MRKKSSPRSRRWSGLTCLALALAAGALAGRPARAQCYYERNRPYRLGDGGASFALPGVAGASLDVGTGALQIHARMNTMPSLVPIVGGWIFTSQDASNGPLGKGTSLPYDFFVVSVPGTGGPYELIGPGNRHFSFATQNAGGDWINTRDPEMLGATLHFTGTGLQSDLRWKTGEKFSFDSAGNLVNVYNRLGYAVQIFRTVQGYPTQIWQYTDRYVGFVYDGNNRLQQVYYQYARTPEPTNRSWLFAYWPDGTLETVTDPTGAVTTFTWQWYTRSDGVQLPRLVKITNPRGKNELTVNLYDSSGRLTKATFANGATLSASYSMPLGSAGNTQVTDLTGDTYGWNYNWNSDSTGYLITSATDPLQRVTTLARTLAPTNLITGITDFRNRTAALGWDSATGNLTSLTLPTSSGGMATWNATYDSTWNQLTSVTEPPPAAGQPRPSSSFTVDPVTGNTTAVTDPRGNTTQYQFNPDGTIHTVTDPYLKVWTYGYDTDGDVLTITDPLAHKWQYGFNRACQVTNATDPNSKIVRFDYDLMDRLTLRRQTIGGINYDTVPAYDKNGNLQTLTDANNHVWEWDYDDLDRLQKELNPLSQAVTYVWSANSKEVTETDRLGQILDYQFGPTGRLELGTFKHTDGTVESSYSLDYDAATDLLHQITDKNSAGATIRTFVLGYDGIDRLHTETRTEGSDVWMNTYDYDDLDRRTYYLATGQAPVYYTPDAAGNITQISQVQNGTNRVFTFQYDALNRMVQRAQPNGVTTAWTFDDAGFLTEVSSARAGVAFDTHTYYQDDGLGNTLVGQIVREDVYRNFQNGQTDSFTNHFGYDDFYHLTSATVEDPATTYSWQYDGVGNRTSQTVNSDPTTYGFDPANRLTSVNGGAVTNDANGNLIAYNGNTYTWDVRNRLIAMTGPGLTASFDYDFLDRRADKNINGTPRTFRWDGEDLVNDCSGLHTRFTLQSPMLDEPLAQYDSYYPDGLYMTPDHLGSSTTLADINGWAQNWYMYQPFGETSQSKPSFDNWNRFRFTGREADETGLYYYRDRYYAPDLGRFISEDPAGLDEFGNQYAYAGNNPVDFIDPFGDATLEAWYRHPGPFHGVQVADHVTLVLRDDGPGGSRKVYYWAGYPSKGLLQGWGNLVVQFEPLAGSKEEQALKQKGARKVTIFSDPMRSFQQAYARLELIQRLINTPPILYGPVPADGSRNSNSAAAAALEQGFGIDPHAYGLDKDPFGNLLPGWNLKINLHRPTTLH